MVDSESAEKGLASFPSGSFPSSVWLTDLQKKTNFSHLKMSIPSKAQAKSWGLKKPIYHPPAHISGKGLLFVGLPLRLYLADSPHLYELLRRMRALDTPGAEAPSVLRPAFGWVVNEGGGEWLDVEDGNSLDGSVGCGGFGLFSFFRDVWNKVEILARGGLTWLEENFLSSQGCV